MDGSPNPDPRGLRIERHFEQNRLAEQFLADVYEQVVPIPRAAIPTSGEIDPRDKERQESVVGRRLEAGGLR